MAENRPQFRALKCAAPLKDLGCVEPSDGEGQFRALKCAAPLKAPRARPHSRCSGRIPRTQMRGSVEGRSGCSPTMAVASKIPRTQMRGSVEGVSEFSRYQQAGKIPRTQMRGSVEGPPTGNECNRRTTEFRALKCAAPLKGW